MKDSYDTTENMRGGARPGNAPKRAASPRRSPRRWSLALGHAAVTLAPAACGGDGLGESLKVAFRDPGLEGSSSSEGETTTGPETTVGPTEPSTSSGEGICGDSVIEGLELCDDGNLVDGDGCENDCTPTVPATCEEYCDAYLIACYGFSEYHDTEACLEQCSQWQHGSPGDTGVDSLECRRHHVKLAYSDDPSVHCPYAGPSGAGVCVDAGAPTCASYCAAYLANCTGDNNEYADETDCLDQCSYWWPGMTGATDGDSVGCRGYHAGGPANSDPETHCPHAGPGGGGVCVVP